MPDPAYPNTSPSNPAINIPAFNFPGLNALSLNPSPNIGRINYGNNQTASRTAGQLKGVGRGIQDILPGLLNSIYRGMTVQAPAVTQSDLALLQALGPQFAQAESKMAEAGQQGAAQANLNVLQNQGRGITLESLMQSMMADPEYYNMRAAINARGTDLLAGMDPNKLTEAELTNAERINNRSNINMGTANTGSNTAGIAGALQFDNRLQAKRSALSNVLGNLGGVLPGFKTNTFDFNNATGQTGRTAGQNAFQNSLNAPKEVASNLAQGALNPAAGLAQNYKQIKSAEIPQWQQTLGTVQSIAQGINSSAPDY